MFECYICLHIMVMITCLIDSFVSWFVYLCLCALSPFCCTCRFVLLCIVGSWVGSALSSVCMYWNFFSLNLVDIYLVWYCCLVLCCGPVLLQMSRRSSKGKDIVADDPATPVAKRTRLSSQASQDPNEDRFRTPLTSHVYSNIFDKRSESVV